MATAITERHNDWERSGIVATVTVIVIDGYGSAEANSLVGAGGTLLGIAALGGIKAGRGKDIDFVWTKKARLKEVGLPTTGKIRFVPPKKYHPSEPLPRGANKGFIDRFGNEWTKGPSRTKGESFEWDVQLSPRGRESIGHLSRDGSHVNVSLDGKVTHR